MVQNEAVWIISGSFRTAPCKPLHQLLSILPIDLRLDMLTKMYALRLYWLSHWHDSNPIFSLSHNRYNGGVLTRSVPGLLYYYWLQWRGTYGWQSYVLGIGLSVTVPCGPSLSVSVLGFCRGQRACWHIVRLRSIWLWSRVAQDQQTSLCLSGFKQLCDC
jgi:hypothetical protein